MRIYNCHAHIFTNRDVPNRIFPLGLIKLLRKRPIARLVRPVGRLIGRFNRRLSSSAVDRYASLLNIGNMESQEEIFELLKSFYPRNTSFVVLAMDFAKMGAGKVIKPYEQQLEELAELKQKYPEACLPFVFADPRRDNFFELVKKAIEEYDFNGIKIYPSLGYYPCNPDLDDLYAYAQEKQIPIMTHCSRGGGYSRKKVKRKQLRNKCTGEKIKRKGLGWPYISRKKFAQNYTDPRNYISVLKRFPKLKLCLGHFGGGIEWDKYLASPWKFGRERPDLNTWLKVITDDLIEPFDNVYADISYILYNPMYIPLLKVLMQDEKIKRRVLYGSDFYVVIRDLSERSFSLNIRAALNDDLYRQIAEINPEEYLFGKIPTPAPNPLPA